MNQLKLDLAKSNESKDQVIQTNRELFQENKLLRDEVQRLKQEAQNQASGSMVLEKNPTSDYQL